MLKKFNTTGAIYDNSTFLERSQKGRKCKRKVSVGIYSPYMKMVFLSQISGKYCSEGGHLKTVSSPIFDILIR